MIILDDVKNYQKSKLHPYVHDELGAQKVRYSSELPLYIGNIYGLKAQKKNGKQNIRVPKRK